MGGIPGGGTGEQNEEHHAQPLYEHFSVFFLFLILNWNLKKRKEKKKKRTI